MQGHNRTQISGGANALTFCNFGAKLQINPMFLHDFICLFQKLCKCLSPPVNTGATALGYNYCRNGARNIPRICKAFYLCRNYQELCEFSESSLHSRWKYKDDIHEYTLTGKKCHNLAIKCGNVVNKISWQNYPS